jgi:hypothetical protein
MKRIKKTRKYLPTGGLHAINASGNGRGETGGRTYGEK